MSLTPVENVSGYTDFIHRFMAQISASIMGMTEEQQHRFFKMITDNADIMTTLFPGSDLFQHAAGQNDSPMDTAILQAYQAWVASQS
jgi:hypothetical protein